MKGYVHQGDHTATRLQTEALRLHQVVCGERLENVISNHLNNGYKQSACRVCDLGLIISSRLTFVQHPLHDLPELVGTDLHVLMERREIANVFVHFSAASSSFLPCVGGAGFSVKGFVRR